MKRPISFISIHKTHTHTQYCFVVEEDDDDDEIKMYRSIVLISCVELTVYM